MNEINENFHFTFIKMEKILLQNRAALLAIGFSILTVFSLLTTIPYMYRIVNDAEQSVIRRIKTYKVKNSESIKTFKILVYLFKIH